MSQIERKLPSGIHVIERYTEAYVLLFLSTATAIGETQEDQFDIGSGNMEPDTVRDFELNFSDFPVGHKIRAVYCDFEVNMVQNTNVTNFTLLMQQTAGVDDWDLEFPWFVKEKTAGTWTRCGFCRSNDFSTPPSELRFGNTVRRGHLDVKGEVNAAATYQFRLGSLTEPWRVSNDSLVLQQFKFVLRVELL